MRIVLSKMIAAVIAAVVPAIPAQAAPGLPAPGAWDGVTEKAKLDRPYEDPRQALIPFGITSYFSHPWRAYMDTHPASQFLGAMGYCGNGDARYQEATLQFMSEAGIRVTRMEIGWGNLNFDDRLEGGKRDEILKSLRLARKYKVRPLLLLNAHHAVPCPIRDVQVELVVAAKKGDRSLKIRPEEVGTVRPGYVGPMKNDEYCAAKPLILAVDKDGICTLSGPLGQDLPAGRMNLKELKYQPLHGTKLKGADDKANQQEAAAAAATLEGWRKYVAEVCELALEGLGTSGQADPGFDLEVWNEQTFGSNFLDINQYCDPRRDYGNPPVYERTRDLAAGMRPDARTHFKVDGPMILVAATVDYVRSRPELAGVRVDNGVGNQWPWNGGEDSWPGLNAYSRHYYHGGWKDISPTTLDRPDHDTMNALGERDGKRPERPRDWYDIIPGSNFTPTVRVGHPEAHHCGWKTESLVRDVLPDSRWGGDPLRHGRFTHNGDYRVPELWQTEVNFARNQFFDEVFSKAQLKRDDPRALALDDYMTGKMLLRQYIFHNHKGLRNLYMFASGERPFGINMLGPAFFQALDRSDGKLTDEARQAAPSVYRGLAWLTQQMEASEPIVATRQLSVDELWEYKPRLMFAGDGSPARPHQWNRDWFALLPYQLTTSKFIIPYYVVTVDAHFAYQSDKDLWDPQRYAMPEQEFEVVIGNCAGAGAKVSVYDPLRNESVPVELVKDKCSASRLAVKLRAVDHPRFLVVEEASPGIAIEEPKVAVGADGLATVAWKTNIPAERARLTYGNDWPNRSADERVLPAGVREYRASFPVRTKGILAARILVEANGLTCVWPRWDEDPQGQVVVPGSTAADVTPLRFSGPVPVPGTDGGEIVALEAKGGIALPVKKSGIGGRGVISFPEGTAFTGPDGDQDASLQQGTQRVRLRLRQIIGGGRSPVEQCLPFLAVGDQIRKTNVKLPSGTLATFVELELLPELHPGSPGTCQRHLLIPAGRDNADFWVLSAEGTPNGMKELGDLVQSVLASHRP